MYGFPPRLHKASTERTNTYKCFAEDYQTERRRNYFYWQPVAEHRMHSNPLEGLPDNSGSFFTTESKCRINEEEEEDYEAFLERTFLLSNRDTEDRLKHMKSTIQVLLLMSYNLIPVQTMHQEANKNIEVLMMQESQILKNIESLRKKVQEEEQRQQRLSTMRSVTKEVIIVKGNIIADLSTTHLALNAYLLCSVCLGGNVYIQIIQKTQGGKKQLHMNRLS
ncbi:hypothetical protein PROFUN_15220 [Planoprotostelium fungivorum]|uniref:Uncharacterized protein n=1 Tax=Planoprotostelium fungivorum TaxID=1890364 RepID=A0A2P6MWX1_9EUKA|nr:hypothetical protein PROFUN_15220 [Planoprotostelium fungivorum]